MHGPVWFSLLKRHKPCKPGWTHSCSPQPLPPDSINNVLPLHESSESGHSRTKWKKLADKVTLSWPTKPCGSPAHGRPKHGHSSEGSLLTSQEELTMLETHVTKIFAKYPQLNRTVHSLPDISATLLGKHIGSMRSHKAVPTGSAPAAAWNLCAPSAGASLIAHLSSQAGHRPCPATGALETRLEQPK